MPPRTGLVPPKSHASPEMIEREQQNEDVGTSKSTKYSHAEYGDLKASVFGDTHRHRLREIAGNRSVGQAARCDGALDRYLGQDAHGKVAVCGKPSVPGKNVEQHKPQEATKIRNGRSHLRSHFLVLSVSACSIPPFEAFGTFCDYLSR